MRWCLRVTWTIINWFHWIYNGTVIKETSNNINYLVMSRVSICQLRSGLGWYKHIQVWHTIFDYNIFSYVFIKKYSRYCRKFWSRGNHQSILNHLEVNIHKIIIMFWVEELHEMFHFIVINWFICSGVWIWNRFRVRFNWKLWRVDLNITIINLIIITSHCDSWNHRTGFWRIVTVKS